MSAPQDRTWGEGGVSQNWKPRGGAQAKPEVRTAGTAVHNICARVLATACFRVTKTSCNWAMYCEVAYNCAQLAAAGNMLHGRGIIGSVQGPMANHHPDPASCHPKSSLAANSASITPICRCMYYPRECNLQKRAPPIKSPPCQSPPRMPLVEASAPLSTGSAVGGLGHYGRCNDSFITKGNAYPLFSGSS